MDRPDSPDGTACGGPGPQPDEPSRTSLSIESTTPGVDIIHTSSQRTVGSVGIRPEILRGVEVSRALSRFGHYWKTSPCDLPPEQRTALYSKSRQCLKLDTFISHAWSTPWWQKHLTLMIHFHWRLGVVALLITTSIFGAVDAAGMMPTRPWRLESQQVSYWAPLPPLISILVLLSGPTLTQGGRADPLVFLDLFCISQSDEELQSEGLSCMAGFLEKSDELLLVWTPQTLRRMWCAFELAVFSSGSAEKKITCCPVFLHLLLFMVFVSSNMSVAASLPMFMPAPLLAVAILVPSVIGVHLARLFMREKHVALKDLARFELAQAQCREEADRKFILESVDHWHGNEDSFNQHVRGPIAARMAATADLDASYLAMLMSTAPRFCLSVQFCVAWARSDEPLVMVVSYMFKEIAIVFIGCPLGIKLTMIAADLTRDLASKVASLAVSTLLGILLTLWVVGIERVAQLYGGNLHFSLASVIILAGLALATFGGRPRFRKLLPTNSAN